MNYPWSFDSLNLNSLGEQAELTFKLIAWFKPSKDISDTLRLGLRKPYATQNRKEPLTLVKSDLFKYEKYDEIVCLSMGEHNYTLKDHAVFQTKVSIVMAF
ncbi:hypothetical protein RclHR1_11850002 [Rhizophagus clarus]|uniref:Uncharacterized protein n=1 Tax=Rhizophagus clarus TaxID=94130 RepID=A0A2Z6Q5H6_9GLOM|nr:hypothetical protein RclHR1_11850002 [Rhizophagus clarus]